MNKEHSTKSRVEKSRLNSTELEPIDPKGTDPLHQSQPLMEGWDSQSPSDLSSSSKTEFKKSKHDSKDNAMEKLRDLESEEKVIVSTSEGKYQKNLAIMFKRF